MCRIGLKEDWVHCKDCDICIHKLNFHTHICRKGAFRSNCPACLEDMFTSTKPVTTLKCGHYMHQHCMMKNLDQQNYQCPTCKKTVINANGIWKQIDAH